ncbi:hypothetical protein V8C35DRAFT_302660 [Trichoderma chlorosporum]
MLVMPFAGEVWGKAFSSEEIGIKWERERDGTEGGGGGAADNGNLKLNWRSSLGCSPASPVGEHRAGQSGGLPESRCARLLEQTRNRPRPGIIMMEAALFLPYLRITGPRTRSFRAISFQHALARSGGRRRSLLELWEPSHYAHSIRGVSAPTKRPPRPSALAHADAASATLLACSTSECFGLGSLPMLHLRPFAWPGQKMANPKYDAYKITLSLPAP